MVRSFRRRTFQKEKLHDELASGGVASWQEASGGEAQQPFCVVWRRSLSSQQPQKPKRS